MSDPLDLLAGRRLLVLVAHTDDETLIGGTLFLLRQRGVEIHLAYATDTAAYGGLEVRQAEAQAAADLLGLAEGQMTFMDLPTLDLVARLPEGVAAVGELLERVRPDVVLTVAFEGGHVDHDALNFCAWEALRRADWPARLYEFPLYNGSRPFFQWWPVVNRFPDLQRPHYVRLTEEAAAFKFQLVRLYVSQWMVLTPIFLYASERRMLRLGEPFREVPRDRDHTVQPHPGCVQTDRWFNRFMKYRFREFAAYVAATRCAERPVLIPTA